MFYFLSMEENANLNNELSNVVNFGRLKRLASGLVFGSSDKLDPMTEISSSIDLGRLKNAKVILEQKVNAFFAAHTNGSAQQIIGQVSDFVKQSNEKFIQNDKILGEMGNYLQRSPHSTYMLSKVSDLAKNNALLQATADGQIAVVESLIRNQANINVKDKNGYTPLMIATIKGNVAIVEMLLLNYADTNIKDSRGNTALMHATQIGNMEIFKMLAYDERTSAENKGEALIIASRFDSKEMVKILIEGKANLNQKDSNGNTSLIHAASRGYAEIVRQLIDHHADLDIKNNDGFTALTIAQQRRRTEIVAMLKKAGAR
jgi:ankyrin repeat protein